MPVTRILGIVLFVIGIALLGYAYHLSTAPVEQISETLTGRYSSGTVWTFILGLVAVIGGGLLALFGVRKG